MKKKLYLHIGMGKTGTTALQHFFWDNRDALAKKDICYPELGIQSCAHHLISPHIPRFLEDQWDFLSVEDWAPTLASVRQSRVLLSSELMAWADPAVARKFCAQVSVWFDVCVVVYLRRQDDIIMASYNQQIKAGPQKRRIDLIYRKQLERFDYLKILAPWADSVGPGKVIVRPYESEQFHRGDIRRDFMFHVLQQEVDEPEFTFSPGDSNPRLPLAAVEYKRMVNNLVTDQVQNQRFNELLMEYSAQQDDSAGGQTANQSVLSPQQRLEILDATRHASEVIARKYLARPDGRLFYQPEPEADEPWEGLDLSRKQAARITRFLRSADEAVMEALSASISLYRDDLAHQKRQSARFLAHSVQRSSAAAPVYQLAPEDQSPIVIGGLGGSGTRLVASLIRRMGVQLAGELNDSLDNLWFSALFVRRSVLLKPDDEVERLAWLFANAMRQGDRVPEDLQGLLKEAAQVSREPVIPAVHVERACASLLHAPEPGDRQAHWGWKEPNSHILLPQLDRCFPAMKFVFVVRNGLDMAFGDNRNQLQHFWGDLMLEGGNEPTPANLLRYWVASHKRMQGFRERMGDRLHFLSFDRLCVDPEGELEALREFIAIPISKRKLAKLADTVSVPKTSGRFRQNDLSVLDSRDIAFVRQMGFEVE